MLRDLILHKGYANASLLKAVRQHEAAAQDKDMMKLLHHILVSNRYWLSLITGFPFVLEQETQIPESLGILAEQYRETHVRQVAWIDQATESDLEVNLESPFIHKSGQSCSVAQALMQVCMHSHGHRAQCSTKLRELGGTPPSMDFILWLNERKSPDWS
jgi:uncharacterized damage-inducible protein DinB